MKAVIAFFVTWAVATCFLTIVGFIAPLAAFLSLAPAILMAAVARSRQAKPPGDRPFTANGTPPLYATYAADNLALDVPGRRLWLRDVSGRTMIVGLADVSAWEHNWTETSNAWGVRFRVGNEIHFRLRRLDTPTVTVRFRRHNDAFSGNRNYEEASQWQARLTTVING